MILLPYINNLRVRLAARGNPYHLSPTIALTNPVSYMKT